MTFKYTLGCDPEFFVREQKTGKIVPICGKIGGTKAEPVQIPGQPIGAKYQEDNVAFEINIPPAYTADQFDALLNNAISGVHPILDKAELELVRQQGSSHRFTKDQIMKTPLVKNDEGKMIPQAILIGCDPDWCAYSTKMADGDLDADDPMERPPFSIDTLGDVRHVGGHIHFGFNKELVPDHIFVRLLDAFLTLPFLPYDAQTTRRAYYGKAGLYRPKEYGVEYRTPSNWWAVSRSHTQLVAARCFKILQSIHEFPHDVAEIYEQLPLLDIKEAIDSGGKSDKMAQLSEIISKLWKAM